MTFPENECKVGNSKIVFLYEFDSTSTNLSMSNRYCFDELFLAAWTPGHSVMVGSYVPQRDDENN